MPNIEDIARNYNGNWKFFQYLTGKGMSIYNTYKYGMGKDVYRKLYECLLRMDSIPVERNAELPMFWNDLKLDGTFPTDMLINGNLIIDIHSCEEINQELRDTLKNKMKLSHCKYGYICNFDRTKFYSEWYVRDNATGIIDRVKLLH